MDFATDFENFEKVYPIWEKKVNDMEFRYRIAGTGEKTLVLLVGGMGISDVFYNHMIRFSEAYTVILFDYPRKVCRNAELAGGIVALLRALGRDKVFLVGQSYGGLLAQVIAKRYPEIVKGLILSNTGCLDVNMSADARSAMFGMMGRLDKAILLTRMIPMFLLRKIFIKRIEKEFEQCTPEEKQYLRDLWRHAISKVNAKHERQMFSLMIDLENEANITRESLAYLDGRVLLLLSKDDDTFGQAVNQALIDMMSNPVINREISGGHLALFVKMDFYIQTVMQFILVRE